MGGSLRSQAAGGVQRRQQAQWKQRGRRAAELFNEACISLQRIQRDKSAKQLLPVAAPCSLAQEAGGEARAGGNPQRRRQGHDGPVLGPARHFGLCSESYRGRLRPAGRQEAVGAAVSGRQGASRRLAGMGGKLK